MFMYIASISVEVKMDKSCALDPLWDIQQSILRALDQQIKEYDRALTSGNAAQ